MKAVVYVVSPSEGSGKTTLIMSIAMKAAELGKRVGYFKPIGFGSTVGPSGELIDEDARDMKEILQLKESTDLLCPIVLEKFRFLKKFDEANLSGAREKIVSSYRKVSEGKELMLIDGPNSLSGGLFLNCSALSLAKEFDAGILLITKIKDDSFLDDLLLASDYCRKLGLSPLGAILNRVPTDYPEAEKFARALLKKEGIEVLGSIPNSEVLSALRVREIYELIGGEILAGEGGMDKLVRNFLVGAMSMEGAIRYFRRTTDKLVIVGGDRTDIISAALETGTSAIIATGGLHPSVKVLPRADELNVPIILVPYDTYTTLQQIQKIMGKIKPGDKARLELAKKLFEENVKWEKIIG
jgi:BioD-like phosphotransacetylase family protein